LPSSDFEHGLPSGTRFASLPPLSLPRKDQQVLGAGLNCSESGDRPLTDSLEIEEFAFTAMKRDASYSVKGG
jgi:hypothetical protein